MYYSPQQHNYLYAGITFIASDQLWTEARVTWQLAPTTTACALYPEWEILINKKQFDISFNLCIRRPHVLPLDICLVALLCAVNINVHQFHN